MLKPLQIHNVQLENICILNWRMDICVRQEF